MAANLGNTTLKRRTRRGNPMHDFDRLPPELRLWLGEAILPWRPKSVFRVYKRVLSKTRDTQRTIETLSDIERRLIAKDTRKIWGADHPSLTSGLYP